MKLTETEHEELMDYLNKRAIDRAIELEALRHENEMLHKEVAKQRRDLLLAGSFMDGADEKYDRLLTDVVKGRVATVTRPKPGITRVCIHGLTEIVRERDIR